MNPKPWLATYRENGIAESVNADAYPSVVHMLDEAMQRYADQPAFRAFGQTLSFADVDRQSAAFAAWLQQRLGVKKGDRIAVMLPNLLAFPIACIGILRAGAVQVNVNPLYTPRELEHQLKDSGSKTIVIFNGSTPTLAEVATQAGIKTVITVAPGDGTAAPLPAPPVDARLAGSSIALADALRQGASMTRTLLWCAGAELAAQSSGDGAGDTCTTGQASRGADRSSHHGGGRVWCGTAGQCAPKPERACTAGAAQAPSALPVGRFDRSHLRGTPSAVPKVRWPDASDCLHHRWRTDQEDSRSHRGRLRSPAHLPGAGATAVG